MTWDPTRLPAQHRRVLAVTGATAGIGYFAAEQLAATGAHVVLVGRNPDKLAAAQAAIRSRVADARLSSVLADLASLESVATAGAELGALDRLDGILLNGGAMDLADGRTADGLPLLLGTHVIANAALVAGALPALLSAGGADRSARVVFTSTGFVRRFPVRVGELLRVPRSPIRAYIHAKTVTELFAFEFDRRARAAGAPLAGLVVRPGVGVDAKTPERPGIHDATTRSRRNPFTPWAQGKDTAAWSAVRAMIDPAANGGEYYAPTGAFAGAPVRIEPDERTARPPRELADRVWSEVERLARIPLALSAPDVSSSTP